MRDLMRKIIYGDHKNVIHARLRHYRELRGLSQNAVAAKLQTMNVNIDQQMLSRIENDQRMVTDYELACLCQILHVSEKELLSDFYKQYR